jgi:2-desacetyl-2-hydroxyethyl bacteriochlorophyllide A dehydrogenase
MLNPTVVFPGVREAIIENREVPKPEAGEVLLKSICSLISIGTEMTAFSGDYPKGSAWEKVFPFPHCPGYSNIGVVMEVGEGVDTNLIGRKFASMGKHAAFVTCSLDKTYPVHEDIPDEHAAFFTIAAIVMNGVRRSGIKWGESATVFGLGLLGHLTTQFCQISGAAPIFAIDPSSFRRDILPDSSSVIKLNPQADCVDDIIKHETRNRMCDVAFEVTGLAKLIPDEFEVLHNQGRFVMLSSPRDKTLFDFHDLCNRTSHTIIGAHNMSHPKHESLENPWTISRHVELFYDLIARRELNIQNMITQNITPNQAPEMYAALHTDRSEYMGVIINWE